MLTQARLREVLQYSPATGLFTWLVRTSNRVSVGAHAGRDGKKGYILIGVDGRTYRAHRLAWLYMTGQWPSDQIDHRNTVSADNRWRNLRDVSGEMNQANRRGANRNNRTRIPGVSATRGGFFARIHRKGQTVYLGYFRSPRAAGIAYKRAKEAT